MPYVCGTYRDKIGTGHHLLALIREDYPEAVFFDERWAA